MYGHEDQPLVTLEGTDWGQHQGAIWVAEIVLKTDLGSGDVVCPSVSAHSTVCLSLGGCGGD